MEKTVILNQNKCGYSAFLTLGKAIIAYGNKGGVKKLDIHRVIVVAENTRKKYGFLSRMGLEAPAVEFNADVDIFLTDGTLIEVHSTEPAFLKKLLPYIWELRKDPRKEFYKTFTRRK